MKDGRLLARLLALSVIILTVGLLLVATSGGSSDGSALAQTVATGAAFDAAAAARGSDLIQSYGCLACHTTNDTSLIGPTFRGLYGSEVIVVGQSIPVVADEQYLRRSIIGAHEQIVESFPMIMPSYVGVLSDEQVSDMVAYLKSIGTVQAIAETPASATAVATAVVSGASPGESAAVVQRGQQLIQSFGCLNCHTTTGGRLVGPTFRGLFGSSVPLMGGSTVQGDEDYLRRSILAAHAQTVEGFPAGVMPDYSGLISDEEVSAMVAYLRTLAGPEAAAVATAPAVAATAGAVAATAPAVAATAPAEASLVQTGEGLLTTYGCLNCHTINGQAYLGPTFLGLYGGTVTLSDGTQVPADDVYLRRSILAAHVEARPDFDPGMMPDYTGIIGRSQLDAIVAYLKSIGMGATQTPAAATATPMAAVTAMVTETAVAPGTPAATPMAAAPAPDAALVATGAGLVQRFGCLGCHTTTGAPLIAPTFRGLFGSTVKLTGGGEVVADAEYLRRSVIAAHQQIVENFVPSMPDYSGVISDEQVQAIVAYLQTIGAGTTAPSPAMTATPMMAATPMMTAAPMMTPAPGVTPRAEVTTGGEAALVATGAGLVQTFGCLGCHTTTGASLIGPTFRGLYGSTVNITGSGPVVADEDYLRRSILSAHEQIVEPFPGVMPGYAGVISPDQLTALVAYLKSQGVAGATSVPQDAAVTEAVMAVTGAQLVRTHGCLGCHTTTGAALIGPTFRGLYGSTVKLTTGESVVASDGFLRQSIIAAHEQVVEPFPNIMPGYAGVFTEDEINNIVAYLKTLVVPAGPPPSAQETALAAVGAKLVQTYGCLGCHTTTGATLIGPTFLDLYGSTVHLLGGSTVVADEAYLKRSIIAAHEQIAEGFSMAMPDYSTVMSDEPAAIVAYLKTLSSNVIPTPTP